MQKREPKLTEDGSYTFYLPEWNEHYHSSHGAIQEAEHVFIENGLAKIPKQKIKIAEYGFGSGLNAFLSVLFSENNFVQIDYLGLEKHPLNFDELKMLNYPELISDPEDYFGKMHRAPWGQLINVSKNFRINKIQTDFRDFRYESPVDLVYFDAFGYRVQPHLWQEAIFKNIFDNLYDGGLLTTYSSKGIVRRMMEKIGFEVEKIPGPKGKREMLNAWKR